MIEVRSQVITIPYSKGFMVYSGFKNIVISGRQEGFIEQKQIRRQGVKAIMELDDIYRGTADISRRITGRRSGH